MPTPSTQSGGDREDDFAESILRPDNYDLFDTVRFRLNARPAEPVASIAADIGVTVDQLCRWVIGFTEKGRGGFYQAKRYSALRPPEKSIPDLWADDEGRRRERMAQKARDGARATREALAGK